MKHVCAPPVAALLALALMLPACSSGNSSALPYMQSGSALQHLNATGAGKIQHIVFIVQENRSFDNLFQGYPGADTVSQGKDSKGKTVTLKPVPLSDQYVIDHSAEAMFSACNAPPGDLPGTHCRMNGFDQELNWGGPNSEPEYVYVPHKDSKPYFDMAHEGVLADRMFQSQLDESFVAHQYIIAAQAAWSVNLPTGGWGCGGGKYDNQHHHQASRHQRAADSAVLRLSDARRRARRRQTLLAVLRELLRKQVQRRRRRLVELPGRQAISTTDPIGST